MTTNPTPKPLSLVFVVDEKNGKVLLGRKKRGFGQGKWNGFGGKMDAGETMEECAVRELREESGLDCPLSALLPRGILYFTMLSDGMVVKKKGEGKGEGEGEKTVCGLLLVHVYSCTLEDVGGELRETEEMKGEWWNVNEVPLKEMWADDAYWLPQILSSEKNDILGAFVFENKSILSSYSIHVLPSCSYSSSLERLKRLRVDHLVYGVPPSFTYSSSSSSSSSSLSSACDWFYDVTGVRAEQGGRHVGLGTYNCIASLGEKKYFEIIARDPEQPNPPKTWMGMSNISSPSLLTFAIEREGGERELERTVKEAREKGYDPQEAQHFSRKTAKGEELKWTLSFNHFDQLPGGGVIPFLISWEKECASFAPGTSAPPGCFLISLCAVKEEGEGGKEVESMLDAVGIKGEDFLINSGDETLLGRGKLVSTASSPSSSSPKRLIATFMTPRGAIEIS